ncbi:MAG TPA: 23S rRNA (uracil(1939)-C(5))-methyltransferase RlmD [Candidatus Acidoferrum sp.]|nr:23S rRNA (uracil(1939)-C(5))-methyltransferase RlmD [Candidatus Acidoferrum sp.]
MIEKGRVMKKNDIVNINITGYTHEGLGVGRVDGFVLFVPQAAAGDRLSCRVVKLLASHGYAKILEVLTPSPDRVGPACPVYERCGGCCYRHISYEAELLAKQQQVAAALRKGLGRNVPCAPCVPSPDILHYRNKALIPFGPSGYGFYRPRSHDIVASADCPIQSEAAGLAAGALWGHMQKFGIPAYDEDTHTGLVRGLFVRTARATGQVMAVIIVNGSEIPRQAELTAALRAALPGLASLQLCVNRKPTNVPLDGRMKVVWGEPYIEDVLSGNRYRISPGSFYQINSAQCERLYAAAGELAGLTGKERVLDLYCGIGTIGLTLAYRALEVVGVEVVEEAVKDAREAAAANGIQNARFIAADAAAAARQLADEGFSPDVVFLDPPRKGCDEALLRTVAGMSPKKAVYVSCNPATLARDAALFETLGYRLTGEALPFDMFPRTAHVEVVVLLQRN